MIITTDTVIRCGIIVVHDSDSAIFSSPAPGSLPSGWWTFAVASVASMTDVLTATFSNMLFSRWLQYHNLESCYRTSSRPCQRIAVLKPDRSSSLIKLQRGTWVLSNSRKYSVRGNHNRSLLLLTLPLLPISSSFIPPLRSDRFPLQRHRLTKPPSLD